MKQTGRYLIEEMYSWLRHSIFLVAGAASGFSFLAVAGPMTIYTEPVTYMLGAGVGLTVGIVSAIAVLELTAAPVQPDPNRIGLLRLVTTCALVSLTYVVALTPLLLTMLMLRPFVYPPTWMLPAAMGSAAGGMVYLAVASLLRARWLGWLTLAPAAIAVFVALATAGRLGEGVPFPLVNAIVGFAMSMAYTAAQRRTTRVLLSEPPN